MKRFILDMILLGLILLVMGFHLLPGLAHEAGGLILLAGAGWHLTLNRRWFGSFFRGRWSGLRLMQTAIGLLLVMAFFTAVITGCIISAWLFRDLWSGPAGAAMHRSTFIYSLHTASAYLMAILGGMHLGMLWPGLWQRLRKFPGLGGFDKYPILRPFVLALICWAGWTMWQLDQVGDRLLMKHIFGTMAARLPAGTYYLMLLGLMGLFGIIAYYLQQYFIRQGRKNQEGVL